MSKERSSREHILRNIILEIDRGFIASVVISLNKTSRKSFIKKGIKKQNQQTTDCASITYENLNN